MIQYKHNIDAMEVVYMKLRKKSIRVLSLLIALSMLLTNLVFAQEEIVLKENVQQIGPHTYYKNINWISDKGIFNINVVETDMKGEYIRIEASDNGKATGTSTVTKQAEPKNSVDSRVIAAINGDFFYTNSLRGLPIGTTIIDGEIRNAVEESTVFGVTYDGECFIDKLKLNAVAKIGKETYAISAVNGPRRENQLILYTPSFGNTTNTNGMGIEVVIKGLELPVKAKSEYKGVIASVLNETDAAEIPDDGVVLSGHGLAAKFLSTLSPGDKTSFTLDFNIDDIKYAVSGLPRLIEKGNVVPDLDKAGVPAGRNPRTAIGIKEGKVIMLTVDGRKKGFSDGMSLTELAEYMLSLGIEDALNLDGGGSTTMIARKQGYYGPRIVNLPSDGYERPIANSVQIISDAPLSNPKYIRFERDSIKIFANSSYTPALYVMDEYFNRVNIGDDQVKFTVSKDLGKIEDSGLFTAGKKAGTGFIEGALGTEKSRLNVQVFDKVASLKILNDYISLEPGEKVQMQVKAYDETGDEIIIDPSAINWVVAGGIGTIDKSGVFTAGNNLKDGRIVARVNSTEAYVDARVGNLPIVLEGFESMDNIEIKSVRAKATATTSQEGEPVVLGSSALKFQYDMKTEETGTSAAYVSFKNPIKVPGKPIEIGFWAYGNGSENWIRGTYLNGAGERKIMNFTSQGGFNWDGWKYVYAEIPKDEKYPISIEQIYIAEPTEEKKSAGTIYFDSLTSLYKTGEDIYSPEVVNINIANNAVLTEQPKEIAIKVRDKGEGIDPESIVLLLNNIQVKAAYDPETGIIRHEIGYKLLKGEHNIRLRLKDKAGNKLNPEFRSTFIYNN